MDKFEIHESWYNSIYDILDDIKFTKPTCKGSISEVACVFDIESTSFYYNDEKRATMYAWVFGINGKCIRGRTWDEFIQVCNILQQEYELSEKKRLIVYVHNLAFEFQFFKDRFNWINNFSLEERKPIYALCDLGIEFRCSCILSGYSLEKVGEHLTKYKVNKLVGDLNYNLPRHSKTPLTNEEWNYILHDGLVVMAYIQEEIERMKGIKKIPLTKTGYVRTLCRNACFNGEERYEFFALRDTLTLTEESYLQFKRTYMGGFTHANARHVGKTLKNVASYDFTSSYPAVMVSEKFPMSKPIEYTPKSIDDLLDMCKRHPCIFDVTFHNITSKVNYEHYISVSRCLELKNEIQDNGRVVEADELTISVTERDFLIIRTMYEWDDIEISNFFYFYQGYLPKSLVETVLNLYVNKTTLKGVIGQEDEYLSSKEMVNAIYGMTVTDPCKNEIVYDNEQGWIENVKSTSDLIEQYNKSRTRFLYYAWGIWVTAFARFNLFTGIIECKEDYIYSDTDSVKILNKDNHKKYFDLYNKVITMKIKECLRYYDIPFSKSHPKTLKGVSKPLGVWDYEGTYKCFKTLGAKRYIYVDEHDELHITIAGVNKTKGRDYLLYKYKTIPNIFKHFKDTLNFPATYIRKYKDDKGKWREVEESGAGKLTHTYIDNHYQGELIDYLGNKNHYDELSSVHLEPAGYDLSLANDFMNYLMGLEEAF